MGNSTESDCLQKLPLRMSGGRGALQGDRLLYGRLGRQTYHSIDGRKIYGPPMSVPPDFYGSAVIFKPSLLGNARGQGP
ncbi:hypothetical protein M513_07459 [Trichuris suis]|uniref:Uncharacterized protein n=1 Tax=Trichuris suis TaxID=68888 RepID=A0A085M2Y4_9BILA|nr:hypothetical protein M513_07459 [Trichuris suis]